MHLRAFALVIFGAALFTACDQGRDYPSNRGDDEYDLEAMALTPDDLPAGFEQLPGTGFTSEEWAEVFQSEDPESKVRQLEAQGWLENFVTESVPPRFGAILNVRSVSTLYTNEAAAKESTEKFACGLPVELSVPLTAFIVPAIADQTNGFFLEEEIDEDGTTLTYTTICFRTGRIVHVVQHASLPGLEDIAFSVRTADSMLAHVNDAFDGKTGESDEEDDEEEG